MGIILRVGYACVNTKEQSFNLEVGAFVSELCAEIGVTPAMLYRYVSSKGELRDYGIKVLEK